MGLSAFKFLWWAPKDRHNGRSRSSKVIDIYTNRKLSIDFLLVINSNFGRILHCFRDIGIAEQRSKNRFFALPTLLWGPRLRTPSEFLDETYHAETRGMGLLYGENCITLTSNAFDWSTRVTDRRTDGIAMAYTRYSIYAVARNEYGLTRILIVLLTFTKCSCHILSTTFILVLIFWL